MHQQLAHQTSILTRLDAVLESFLAIAEDLFQILRFFLYVQAVVHHLP